MQCLVLAGGLGRRMLPATDSMPKCLLPVAGHPFVDWQLAWLASEGVRDVLYSIGYRGEVVRRHLGDGSRFGLGIRYVDEGARLRGTAGALRLALDLGVADSHFFVVYGDSYLPVSLRQVEEVYSGQDAPVLMTVYRDPDGLERPNAIFDGRMVTRYQKGLEDPPPEMRYVDYGLSVWERNVVDSMVAEDAVADLADVFAALSGCGKLGGFEACERFYEIGSPQGLKDLESRLLTGEALALPPALR
jgi:N-acetyl-alpha-D-muramate 1-phosphate uridylyltransferase